MPRGRGGRKPSKLYGLGLLGGVGSGVGSGLLYHIIDPPWWLVMAIEVAIAVAVLLLTIPRSPQTPNLNLIPIIH